MEKRRIVRVPRPLGITMLAREFQALPEEERKQSRNKLVDTMIYHWLTSNGNICGTPIGINELANKLGVDTNYIQLYMRDQVLNSKVWDASLQQEILESLMGQQLAWVLEDRMEVQNQVEILKTSQGGKYAPFISAELNKALKLKLETSTSLQTLFRTLTGGGGTTNNFFTQINHPEEKNKGIQYEEALEIIEEQVSKGLTMEEKRSLPAKYVEDNYELDNLPTVCALEQEGVNVDKEGLTLNKTELSQVTDNYNGNLEIADAELESIENEIFDHHDTRRQLEIGEDMEADDPECTIYDEKI